jgi:hypothetical protein
MCHRLRTISPASQPIISFSKRGAWETWPPALLQASTSISPSMPDLSATPFAYSAGHLYDTIQPISVRTWRTNKQPTPRGLTAAITKAAHNFSSPPHSPLRRATNLGSEDESQWIAAWKLLYRVRHPGPNVSRLQTIPHSDVGSSRDPDHQEQSSTDLHRAYTCKGDGHFHKATASASVFGHRTSNPSAAPYRARCQAGV